MNRKICLATVLLMVSFCLGIQASDAVTQTTSTAEDNSELIEQGEDSFTYRCPGVGGYDVLFEGAHGRSWINLVYDSEQTNLMDDLLNACPGEFPAKADEALVWRGTMQGEDFVPYACIVRMTSMVEGQQTENFVILQLAGAGSRVVGQVPGNQGLAGAEADKLCKFE